MRRISFAALQMTGHGELCAQPCFLSNEVRQVRVFLNIHLKLRRLHGGCGLHIPYWHKPFLSAKCGERSRILRMIATKVTSKTGSQAGNRAQTWHDHERSSLGHL